MGARANGGKKKKKEEDFKYATAVFDSVFRVSKQYYDAIVIKKRFSMPK